MAEVVVQGLIVQKVITQGYTVGAAVGPPGDFTSATVNGGLSLYADGPARRVDFVGTGTAWLTDAPTFTVSAGSLGAVTVDDDTNAHATFTPPATAQTVTFTCTSHDGADTLDVVAFTPLALGARLKLFLESDVDVYSDAGVTPAVEAATVREWHDQGPDSLVFSQATAGARPTYRASHLGDMGGLSFDTADDYLECAAAAFLNGATDVSIFLMTEQDLSNFGWSAGVGGVSVLEHQTFSLNRTIYHAREATLGSYNGTPHSGWLSEVRYVGAGATNADKLKVFSNGRDIGGTFGGTAFPASLAAANGFRLGVGYNAGNPFLGIIRAVVVVEAPTDTERASVLAYLSDRMFAGTRKVVTTVGDSITHGSGAGGVLAYPTQLATALGRDWHVVNMASGGTKFDTQWEDWANTLAYPPSSHPLDIEVVGIGRNDLSGSPSEAAMQGWLTDYWASAAARGVQVVAWTYPDSLNVDATLRANVNAWIRLQSSLWDAIVDLAADARLADKTNTTYFPDQIHLTAAGYAVVVELLLPVLESFDHLYPPLLASSAQVFAPTVTAGGAIPFIDGPTRAILTITGVHTAVLTRTGIHTAVLTESGIREAAMSDSGVRLADITS